MAVQIRLVPQGGGEVRHFEYGSLDEAIVGLGKMVKVKAAEPLPVTLTTAPSSTLLANATPPAPQPEKQRKPRADKGQPRGPHKDANVTTAAVTGAAGDNGATAPATGTDPRSGGQQAPTATSTTAPAAPATPPAPVAVPTADDVQAAVEKLFAKADYDGTAAALQRFGVARGKDLAADQRASFIRRVEDIVAGKYDATGSWPELV